MISLILVIFILGLIILIHEFGHFLFSKLFGVYVYEFSIGMGKRLWFKKKGDTEYSIRAIPLGGYVSLAGEEIEDDTKVPKDKKLMAKPTWQRFLIMFAGAGFNFVLALVLLFISALIFGSVSTKPIIGTVTEEYPAYEAGLREGDLILEINDVKVKSWDAAMWEIQMSQGAELEFYIEDVNGITKTINVTPLKEENEDGTVTYKYGIGMNTKRDRGLISSATYAFNKTGSTFKLMGETIKSLFSGEVGVNELSGPVGIFTVVDQQKDAGLENIIYLIAFLSINVGVINLLPFPAFDGGRILFLIIEKIKGSPVSPKVENTIHQIGFYLLVLLILYVTCNDIFRLFQ